MQGSNDFTVIVYTWPIKSIVTKNDDAIPCQHAAADIVMASCGLASEARLAHHTRELDRFRTPGVSPPKK